MRRPLSITLVACLFIAAGGVGLAYHAGDFRDGLTLENALVSLVRLLAVVGGVFLLRGHDWARWLLLAWLAFHVVLSAFHNTAELAMHTALLVVIGSLLLRPKAAAYFRPAPLDSAGV